MANYQNNMRCMNRPAHLPSAYSCECRRTVSAAEGCPDTQDHFPAHMPVAMAYVPWQNWKDIYEPCKALESGTLFPELDKPFLGKGGTCR